MTRIGRIAWALIALTVGCSAPAPDGGKSASLADGTGDGATTGGAQDGSTFAAKEAISADAPGGGGKIFVGSTSGLCGLASSNQWPAHSQDLFITLEDTDADGKAIAAPPVAATYTIETHLAANAHVAQATYLLLDDNCSFGTDHHVAVGGTVTLTRTAGGSYAGSYDLTFENPHDLVGTFDASACSGYAAESQDAPGCGH